VLNQVGSMKNTVSDKLYCRNTEKKEINFNCSNCMTFLEIFITNNLVYSVKTNAQSPFT